MEQSTISAFHRAITHGSLAGNAKACAAVMRAAADCIENEDEDEGSKGLSLLTEQIEAMNSKGESPSDEDLKEWSKVAARYGRATTPPDAGG